MLLKGKRAGRFWQPWPSPAMTRPAILPQVLLHGLRLKYLIYVVLASSFHLPKSRSRTCFSVSVGSAFASKLHKDLLLRKVNSHLAIPAARRIPNSSFLRPLPTQSLDPSITSPAPLSQLHPRISAHQPLSVPRGAAPHLRISRHRR